MSFTVLTTKESGRWDELVRSTEHDFYHLASYHRLAEEQGEGEARLLVVEDHDGVVLLPILLQRVASVPGLEFSPLTDVTSVYGYAGPLVRPRTPSPRLLTRSRAAFQAFFDEHATCCVFSRFHPLFAQAEVVAGLGTVKEIGPTVSIDLISSPEEQWASIRRGHKYDIGKLRRSGLQVVHDRELRYLDEFVHVYRQTMLQVGAEKYYLFDREYFRRFFALEGVEVNLFVGLAGEELACGAIFTLTGGIVQYHLSGASEEYAKLAPTKLLIDEVRRWAAGRRATVFHLGGGVGSRQDSLFAFKAGFSKRRHTFSVWTWVRDPEAYEQLVAARSRFLAGRGERAVSSTYFPAYRSPVEPDAVGASLESER